MKPTPIKRPRLDILETLDPEPPPLEQPAPQVQVLPAIDGSLDAELDASPLPRGDEAPPDDLPASLPPRGKMRRGSRSGSRTKPYVKADGSGETIKESFTASTEFDDLWRALPGLLPRDVTRSEWTVRVLTRAILALKAKR